MKANRLVAGAAFALAALLGTTSVQAQGYPSRPITVIIPFAGGSASDVVTRIMLDRMSKSMNQAIVVENRPGAGGNIAGEAVARSPADGYTLLLSSAGPIVINPALYPRLGYDPQRDLAPIALIASSPLVLVLHPSVPAKSLHDLIALARSRPNQLIYGSGGNGSPPHLTAELFKSLTGTRMTHVPFKGSAPSVIALVGGQVDLSFSTVAITLPQIQAGRVRAQRPLAFAIASFAGIHHADDARMQEQQREECAGDQGVRCVVVAHRGHERQQCHRGQEQAGAQIELEHEEAR